MGHHHHHNHHQHEPSSYDVAFGLAVALNLVFTIIEAVYALYANSSSLLADAGHNLGDVVGLLLAWGANWLMTRQPKSRYSYGFKRATIYASVVNAVVLLLTAAVILVQAIKHFIEPEPIKAWVVVVVAGIGIAVNAGTALLFYRGYKQDLNIKGAFLHLAYDALISLGVVIAATLMHFTGWQMLDPLMALGIVGVMVFGTWGLLRDSLALSMDAVPRHIDHEAVREYLRNVPGVNSIHDLHIWGLSTREVALTVHIDVGDHFLSREALEKMHTVLHDEFNIAHATIQVENNENCPLENKCDH